MLWLVFSSAFAITGASMDFHGTGAIQPDAPNLAGEAGTIAMGCGGIGFTFLTQRKNTTGLRPASTSVQISLADVCQGIGASTDSFYFAPINAGLGAQWGGSVGYFTAEATVGIGAYSEEHGPGSLSNIGPTARLRAAPGIHLGFVGIEVGPTLRVLAPLYTKVDNAYPDGMMMNPIGSFDVVIRIGNSVPNHNNHPLHGH